MPHPAALSPDSPAISAALARLPEHDKALLFALSIAPAGLTRSALLKALNAQSVRLEGKRLDATTLEALLTALQHTNWLDKTHKGQLIRLKADRRNMLLRVLAARKDIADWATRMQTALPIQSGWGSTDRSHIEPHVWLLLLAGEYEPARQTRVQLIRTVPVNDIPATHPLPLLLADTDGRALLVDTWPRSLIVELTNDYLQLINYYLLPNTNNIWETGLLLWEGSKGERDRPEAHSLAYRLLPQALLRGELESLKTLGTTSGHGELAEFLLQLASGNAAAALQALERWLQLECKRRHQHKIQLPRPLEALRLLALMGTGEPADKIALQKSLLQPQNRQPGWLLLEKLLEHSQGLEVDLTPAFFDTLTHQVRPHALGALVAMLALHWLEQTPPAWLKQLQMWREQWQQAGFHWLAAECTAVLVKSGVLDTPLNNWHTEHNLTPLLALHRPREPWEHALEALAKLTSKPAEPTAIAPKVEKRLAWIIERSIDDIRLELREQKRGTKNQWSKGRQVLLHRLHETPGEFDFLTEHDRRALRAITRQYAWYDDKRWFNTLEDLPPRPGSNSTGQKVCWSINATQALPHLIGHPALYRGDAPDVRVDLVAGEPSLHLHEAAGQIHLTLEPPELASHEIALIDETPTRLLLYQRNHEIAQIAEIIGRGLTVPLEARQQLVEAISAMAPRLPVHSDISELSAHLTTLPGDTTLYAHLLPLSEGLRLQFLVHPHTDGSWLKPGYGAAHVLGKQDGRPVQIQRDLEGERATLHYALEHCPTLAMATSDGQEWRLEHAQNALQLLTELQALDHRRVQSVWPEGERMRIRARPGLGQLRLTLGKQGDWFALQGNITLDDGRVLQLKQLLELVQASRGRFVRIGEGDWLALSDDLHRHLDDLSRLSDRIDDHGARLNLLAAPLLETLAEETGDFTADAEWHAHLATLRSLRDFKPRLPHTLQAELRDYQHEGFTWLARLAEWGVGACLADDMGLGKTVQILALLLHRAQHGPQLVVAPTSVVANWQTEAQRFAPSLRLVDYRNVRSLDTLGPGHLVLVSYGLLQQDQASFAAQRWTTAVLDEAQAVKNSQTKRSQAVMALDADFRVIATGTPLENHLGELWNLFRFINPGLLGSQERFAARFAYPIENGDSAARRALKQLIQPFLLRRLKNQVLDELPPRTDITHRIALSDNERHQYEALRQQAVDELSKVDENASDKPFQVLAQITRLRRFCCHPSLVLSGSQLESSKLRALAHIIEELIDNGHRALIFSQFVDHLAIVRRWLDGAGIHYQYLDGATPPKARTRAVDAFQAGEGNVFLISLKAGGSGLNLTAADYVIHLDPWWNPAVEDQASDRAHRIGQQRPVTVYRLVAEHTIEEQIVALHTHKRDLADSLLEGGQASARLDAEALLDLIRQR